MTRFSIRKFSIFWNSNDVNFFTISKPLTIWGVGVVSGGLFSKFFLSSIYHNSVIYYLNLSETWSIIFGFAVYIYLYAGLSSYVIGNKRFSILLLVPLCFISDVDG